MTPRLLCLAAVLLLCATGACSHAEAPIVAAMSMPPPMRRDPPPRETRRERDPNATDSAQRPQVHSKDDIPVATVMAPGDDAVVTHPEPGDERFNEDETNGPAVLPKTLAKSTLAMALRLYDLKAREPGNFVISPYDLLRVLTMAQAGSNRGSTEEIGQVLHLEMPAPQVIAGVRQVQDSFYKIDALHAGNAVLIAEDTGLSTDMKNKLVQAFGSRIERRRVDDMGKAAHTLMNANEEAFSAQDKGSQVVWANLSLGGSRMALLGSTRYVSKWDAKKGKSALLAKKGEVASFSPNGPLQVYEDDAYRAIQVPGKTPRFAMVFIFPKNGKAGLKAAPPIMNMQALLDGLAPKEGVKLNLPAVSSTTTVNLTAAVRDMGMQSLFDSRKSELSNLGPAGTGLYARDLVQGVVLDLNDQGMTWSVYSALKFNSGISKAKLRPAKQNLLMPFLFLLHDTEWHIPLMFGRVEAL